jgi:hypothetical protein
MRNSDLMSNTAFDRAINFVRLGDFGRYGLCSGEIGEGGGFGFEGRDGFD